MRRTPARARTWVGGRGGLRLRLGIGAGLGLAGWAKVSNPLRGPRPFHAVAKTQPWRACVPPVGLGLTLRLGVAHLVSHASATSIASYALMVSVG